MPELDVCGEVRIKDGVIEFWHRDRGLCGLFYVGPDGPTFEQIVGGGELTLFSKNDLPKLRMAVRQTDGKTHFKVGAISFNVIRPDGRNDEIAYLAGATAEDSDYYGKNDVRGQVEVWIRPDTDIDMQQAFVLTTAYADDLPLIGLPAIDPRTGKRSIWGGFRNMLNHLWKFE